jgi:hypothetical protein
VTSLDAPGFLFEEKGGEKMKPWVKPYLLNGLAKTLDEIGASDEWKQLKTENFIESLESHPETAWWELPGSLNTHFGLGGLGGPRDWFTSAFGSVLADLPEEVFLKLCGMKNVFFTFTPNPGAEIKPFILVEDIKTGEALKVVTFPYVITCSSPGAARGTIAHELAHLYAHPDKYASDDAMEDEADEIAKSWGFEQEVEEMRDYHEGLERSLNTDNEMRTYVLEGLGGLRANLSLKGGDDEVFRHIDVAMKRLKTLIESGENEDPH